MKTTRRGFIERSAAGLLTSVVAAQTSPQSTSDSTVGLIGSGIRGTWLMKPALDAGAKIAIVCDLYFQNVSNRATVRRQASRCYECDMPTLDV
jgi:hypothetical protein